MTATHAHPHRLLAKQDLPPEGERALREFTRDFADSLDPLRRDIAEAIEAGDIKPERGSVRVAIEQRVGNYTTDIQEVYRQGTEQGAEAGRAAAGRVHGLDIAFDRVPQRVLDEFDDWSEEIVEREVMETITDDVTGYIRGAQEEGWSNDVLAERINEDLFDNRLQDHVARRNARTGTIGSSNAGAHSAHVDADSVVGEEWLATGGSRTRATHAAADGQVVAPSATFQVGGFQARYPGDPGLPVGEMANCRCTTVPRFADEFGQNDLATLLAGGRLNV